MTPTTAATSRRAPSEDAILIVEDDPLMRAFLERGLDAWFHIVAVATDLQSAKALLSSGEKFCAVVSDHDLPDGHGAELFTWMRERTLSTPFVLISGGILSKRSESGFRFLAKPFALKELLDQLADLIQSGRTVRR
jgi:DNA-binding NtrC family response regulator